MEGNRRHKSSELNMEPEEIEVQEEENLNEGTLRAIVRSILHRKGKNKNPVEEIHEPPEDRAP
jgi:hypothetical protein